MERVAGLATLLALALGGCSTMPPPSAGLGALSGRVVVEWAKEDGFIFRRQSNQPLVFVSSRGERVEPQDMYTDGGSIPRVFWSIDGLSPWGLGPAYVIHDWIFFRHRCGSASERAEFTFDDSVRLLAEVGQELIRAKLVEESGDFLPQIVWAVSSPYARALWDRQATAENCARPTDSTKTKSRSARDGSRAQIAIDLAIPPPQRR